MLNLYVWQEPKRIKRAASPRKFAHPNLNFTVAIPALHEEEVIGQTIESLSRSNYPAAMLQILVVIDQTDTSTIKAANKIITKNKLTNVEVLTFDSTKHDGKKPGRLNLALDRADHDIFTIFDAEDEIHPDIFNVINTLYARNPKVDVIQSGVQLMDYDRTWYSAHNVLEYYFWYKSRMHIHSSVGVVPLGGNTVFFKTEQARQIGGWNEKCLTEDADIGIRITAAGKKVLTTYNPVYATKEGTPPTAEAFIRQRTRWNQGFLQVLGYGDWQAFSKPSLWLWTFYILGFSVFQVFLLLLSPVFFIVGLGARLPVWLALISFLPLLITFILLVIQMVALHTFVKEQRLRHKLWVYALFPLTFMPYQIMLGIGAIRAIWREWRKSNDWELTPHSNAHRQISLSSTPSAVNASPGDT